MTPVERCCGRFVVDGTSDAGEVVGIGHCRMPSSAPYWSFCILETRLPTGPRLFRPSLYVQPRFLLTHLSHGLLMSQRTLRALHWSQALSAADFNRPFGTPAAVSRTVNMVHAMCGALLRNEARTAAPWGEEMILATKAKRTTRANNVS